MPSKAKIQQEIEQTEPKTILTKPFTIMKYMDTRNGIFKKMCKCIMTSIKLRAKQQYCGIFTLLYSWSKQQEKLRVIFFTSETRHIFILVLLNRKKQKHFFSNQEQGKDVQYLSHSPLLQETSYYIHQTREIKEVCWSQTR